MLGTLRAILPGVAFAQSSAAMVSLWAFDETTDTSGVFDDLGPANVPMSLVGTWADLTTGSLVQNVGGTSAYTNGTAYATIPANGPAHNLAALTISFYYQRNAAAAKQVLLAVGNGTQVGDLSIEVLADGKLRGYHVGQDNVLRFFGSTDGISGTDLQVGTAHRIDLALGPRGARIFLDGAELTAAAIPSNLNGWNNGQTKYLGVFSDGASGPAIGAFDRFRIWSWQLTNLEIALLEKARPATLPPLSPEGEALSVPSLTEWLPSDEIDPVATKFVSNQNRGDGSGSSPANAQEVQAALNGASPGDVLLAVCQTAGTVEHWNYPNGLIFPNGSAGNPITLQARHGDAVVICDNSFAVFRTRNSGAWTQSGLSQADIDKKIWRSTATFGSAATLFGYWVEFDHLHQLLPYGNITNLRSAYGTADSFTNYAGPGAHLDSDGRVYIRMQRPHPGKYSAGGTWQNHLWPDNPEAVNGLGQLVYPISEDPNDYEIRLVRRRTGFAFSPSSGISGGFIKIGAGINSCGYERTIRGHDITMRRGTHLVWHNFIVSASDTNPHFNYDIQRCRFSEGCKKHLARSEWKFGGPLEGVRSAFIQHQGATNGSHDLYFKDCTIADFHEIAVARADRWRFRNCTFANIFDDGIQGISSGTRVEFGYCYFYNSAIGGNGAGGGNDPTPGGHLVHHNIFDYRTQRCYNWRANPGPGWLWLGHSPSGSQPKKIYNNLILWGPDVEENSPNGLSHEGNRNNTLTGTAAAHEVFNNIVIRHDRGRRYNADQYSDVFTTQSDYAHRQINCDADLSNEFWDYNLYYRNVPEISSGGFADSLFKMVRAGSGSAESSFNTLAGFLTSALFTLSKAAGDRRGAYPAGFEANGTDAKPTVPSLDNFPADRFRYRPSVTTAVIVATTSSLSGANWWSTPPTWGTDYFSWSAGGGSLAPSGWKGALDPNGSTINVGVLDS